METCAVRLRMRAMYQSDWLDFSDATGQFSRTRRGCPETSLCAGSELGCLASHRRFCHGPTVAKEQRRGPRFTDEQRYRIADYRFSPVMVTHC